MLEGMGSIYLNAVRFVDAKLAFERSLALRRGNGGGASAEAATTLVHLADALRSLGNYAAADSVAWQALRIYQNVNGPADPYTADAWQMLSMLAVYRGDLAASATYARRAFDIRAAAYGADDPRIAYALEMLGGALHRLHNYDEAERDMRQALALYEREKGPNDPWLIVPLYRLAEAVANSRADYSEATRLMERAFTIARGSFGDDHPRTAYTIGMLAELESRRGNVAKAERLGRQAVDIFDRKLGRRHVAVGDAYADLAKVYARAGRWADVEAAQQTALTIYGTALGREHPVYAGVVAGLCETHLQLGGLPRAEGECRQALSIRERAQGPNSLAQVKPMLSLGDIRARRGDLATADSLYSTARAILEKHVGTEPVLYERLYPRMAALRDLQGRSAEAAELRKKSGGKPVRPLGY
jgi:serine/threonine-protein kinase